MTGPASVETLGRLGIWSGELRSADARPAASELGAAGWQTFWIPGAGRPGIWADAERLLRAAPETAVALGVMNIWGADADQAAEQHSALTNRYGRRLLVGLGVGSPASAAAAGQTYTTPLEVMNAYLDRQDADPRGISVDDRILGALGPRMTGLAGSRAAGSHSFLATPEGTRRSRQLLGTDKLLAPYLPVTLESDPARARDLIRTGVGIFIGFPSYRANLQRLGFSDDDLRPGGSDRLIDAVSAWGSLEVIDDKIRRHRAAGADHVAIHVITARRGLPTDAWRALAPLATQYATI